MPPGSPPPPPVVPEVAEAPSQSLPIRKNQGPRGPYKKKPKDQFDQGPQNQLDQGPQHQLDPGPQHGDHPLNLHLELPERRLQKLDPSGSTNTPNSATTMTTPPAFFHALLRPSVLQVLRAQGFHGARTSVADTLTDLAARYLSALCERTARHALHHNQDSGDEVVPSIVDVRMALEEVGALLPQAVFTEQQWLGVEDEGNVAEFIKWFSGPRNREIKRVALDGDEEHTDYLTGEFSGGAAERDAGLTVADRRAARQRS